MNQVEEIGINAALQQENRILREALQEILSYPPHFAYASGSSHPDTNRCHQHMMIANRGLRHAGEVAHEASGGSE